MKSDNPVIRKVNITELLDGSEVYKLVLSCDSIQDVVSATCSGMRRMNELIEVDDGKELRKHIEFYLDESIRSDVSRS